MKNFILSALFLCFCHLVQANDAASTPPSGVVTKLRGTVTYEGNPIKEGSIISGNGKIETKESSFVQFKIDKWKNTISVGPNSAMAVNLNDPKQYVLNEGTCRWKAFAESAIKGKIHTKRASMGVRGTDFYVKSNSLLGETEIIMFSGEVLMENSQEKSNTALLKKGQWGGIGGRFGEKISPVLNLPIAMLDSTEKSLE